MMTTKEDLRKFVEKVEAADFWDVASAEEWADAYEFAGIGITLFSF